MVPQGGCVDRACSGEPTIGTSLGRTKGANVMLHGLIPKCNRCCIAFKGQARMGNLAIIPEQHDSHK